MKTFVVAYDDPAAIDNHIKTLFPIQEVTIEKDIWGEASLAETEAATEVVRVLFHNSPVALFSGGAFKKNYDILVTSTVKASEVGRDDVVILPRFTKLQQSQMVAAIGSKLEKSEHLLNPRVWDVPEEMYYDPDTYQMDKILFKYVNGARGILQLLCEGVENINKATLFNNFRNACYKVNKLQLDYTDVETTNKLLSEHFAKELNCAVKWSGYEQRDSTIVLTAIETCEFMAQEFVENVDKEYRVIIGADETLHFFERSNRDDRPFNQATGAKKSIYTKGVPDNVNLTPDVIGSMVSFLTNLPKMNSVDLFITKDNRFGIFEFCNQFGIDCDDPAIYKDIHKTFIKKLVARYI